MNTAKFILCLALSAVAILETTHRAAVGQRQQQNQKNTHKSEQILKLMQRSTATGAQVTYLSQRWLRIVNEPNGLCLESSAPQWAVRLYNTQTKAYCVLPREEFKGLLATRVFWLFGVPTQAHISLTVAGNESVTVSGVKVHQFLALESWIDPNSKKVKTKKLDMWCADQAYPLPLCEIKAKFDGLPPLPKLILKIRKKNKAPVFDTIRSEYIDFEKLPPLSAAHYRKVASEQDVLKSPGEAFGTGIILGPE